MLVGCSPGQDVSRRVAQFESVRTQAVSRMALLPIDPGTNLARLEASREITNRIVQTAVLAELAFPRSPKLPGRMDHAGGVGVAQLLVVFQNGEQFAVLVLFCRGPSGKGVEYAMSSDVGFTSVDDKAFPPANTYGRGFSVELYDLLLPSEN